MSDENRNGGGSHTRELPSRRRRRFSSDDADELSKLKKTSVSAATAFTFAMLRLLSPHLFYLEELIGSEIILHYFLCGLITVTSVIGFFNSGVVMFRATSANTGRNITTWLLLDSLFETARVLQLFMSEVLVHSNGPAQKYDLILGGVQYLIDSLLYCQVILRKQ